MLSRTNLPHSSHRSTPNPRPLKSLQPLCRSQKSQLLWNQANPASFCKHPGWGMPSQSRPCGISNIQPLVSRPVCNSVNEILAERPLVLPPASTRPGSLRDGRVPLTTFRINTCKSVSKQRTLTISRINTCAKTGEGGLPAASSVRSPEAARGREDWYRMRASLARTANQALPERSEPDCLPRRISHGIDDHDLAL